jgi:hypothetical protein
MREKGEGKVYGLEEWDMMGTYAVYQYNKYGGVVGAHDEFMVM